MEREACVCDHGYERSDLCAEIIIIIITEGFSAILYCRPDEVTLGNPCDTMKRFCLYSQCSHLNL